VGIDVLDDVLKIMDFLPHRAPFLLVDRVLEFESGKRIVALKNVTYNEPFFTGHFPTNPIMPGVLVIEALAQAAGLLAMKTITEQGSSYGEFHLVSIDKARFKRNIVPGDQLFLEAFYLKDKRNFWSFHCEARVDNQMVASADIMCASTGTTA